MVVSQWIGVEGYAYQNGARCSEKWGTLDASGIIRTYLTVTGRGPQLDSLIGFQGWAKLRWGILAIYKIHLYGGGGNVPVALIVNSSRCGKRSFTWYSLKLVFSVQRMLISILAADTSLWVVLYSCIELIQGLPWYNFLYVVETLPSVMLTESRSEQERSVI
jgi:hypothetical protein